MEEEYFDSQTTYKYLSNIGKPLGQIYVNDAPLSCLTSSNSVAEIKCDRKVMGVKMTEDVRKLAQFFLKKYPLSVNERHIEKPPVKDYYDNKFLAVLGGQCKSITDLLDKIMLANSLMDHATVIYLLGEAGLAAIHALDMDVTRIERFASYEEQIKEYEELKPFYQRLFEIAAEKNVLLQLPTDFVTAPFFDVQTKTGILPKNTPYTTEKKESDMPEEKSGTSLRKTDANKSTLQTKQNETTIED